MVIHDYELNLSLQEYLYFNQCPQKFRIYRILNPIPNKNAFLTAPKRTTKEYEHRGYTKQELDGIRFHLFASAFHRIHYQSIHRKIFPKELGNNSYYTSFWKYQQQRFQESEGRFSWFPFQTELSAMTEKQRGIIDCLEFINNDEEIRLIDYKKNKNRTDFESLYFYAILFDDFKFEMNWEGIEIKEIGYYYYSSGELVVQKYNINLRGKISDKIRSIQEKIKNIEFRCVKKSCIYCNFKIICEIEKMR